ncbi:hypothetical protein ACFO4O_15075 [Glaciecola siphonariae]|uniref:Pentapeptide repeat-containing protein n=1 Tax=Glaciecola siphonariae TaxID=521012 RepID=A0ABV9LY43_9ALTE
MKALNFENKSITSRHIADHGVVAFSATNCKFVNCHFEKFNAREVCFGAGIGPTQYIDCTFSDVTIASNAPGRAIFKLCRFENVRFVKLFCTEIIFIDCSFNGTFEKGSLVGELLVNEDYTDYLSSKTIGNDFSQFNIKDVSFHEFNFHHQKFSNNDKQRIISNLSRFISSAREKINSIESVSLCDEAYRVLKILELKNEDGNNQAFLNPTNFPKALQPAAELLLSFNN